MSVELSTIRNIGIAAHIDAGKTTTTERILYYARRTHRMGDVDDGTTTTDFDEQEQTRGITIYSAAVTFPWKNHSITLIDTPGHVDFTAEVERSLRVLDGMVALFDAREGVEAQSETIWRQADKYRVPRICFINKMDRVGADFERSVASIGDRLPTRPVVVQLPIGSGPDFQGLIDLIEMRAVYYPLEALGSTYQVVDIPAELLDSARVARQNLVETVSEHSDALLEQYLRDEDVEADALRSALRRATIQRELVPVLCGSALRYIGVQRLLDAVCDFLPSPVDVPPVEAEDAHRPDRKLEIVCSTDAPLAALVFKVVADRPVDLTYLRIYAGTLKAGSRLLNTTLGEKENVTRIYRMFAKRRDQLDQAQAGDIVAIVGPKKTLTGHTLCDPRRPVVLEPIEFPNTVISVSVEPKVSKDREKLLEALAAVMRQDPTIAVMTHPETGQTLISGMGELHLEVTLKRLKTEMKIDVSVSNPRVSYRETVTVVGEGEGRFLRQIGGRAHFAVVRIRLEAKASGRGRTHFEIQDDWSSDNIDPVYVEAVKLGIVDASQSGILGGYKVIDWKATLLGGTVHETDSSEMAFENAGRNAFYAAMKAAGPVLLEPIMAVEVVTSQDYFGAIMGDLNARNAAIRDTAVRGQDRIISAHVPLSRMFGYVTRLRSLSQGRATSTMAPSHYAPVSSEQMKQLVG